MKIVVLVKETPDTYGDRKLSLETGLADRSASDAVLDEIGERAVEAAISYAESHEGVEVILLSMAPSSATASIRKGLAMGAASAVHVVDDDLLGADLGLTAQVLAKALDRVGFDLVIAGNQSTDGAGGVIPTMIAEILDVPSATYLGALNIEADSITGERASDGATMTVRASLPAVVSVTEALPDGRLPNFKGIMAAKKKPFETLSLADLDIDALSPTSGRSIMITVGEKPPRQAGVKMIDGGDAAVALADYLVDQRLL